MPNIVMGNQIGLYSITLTDPAGLILSENFEASGTPGYDQPGWVESVPAGATIDSNDTTATILRGTQQLKIIGGSAAVAYTYFDFGSGYIEAFAHFLFKAPDATPAATMTIFAFRRSDGFAIGQVQLVSPTGVLRAVNGGTTVSTVSALANGTAYRIWVYYYKSSGANDGVMQVEFTPTSTHSPIWVGNAYAISTNGIYTNNVQQVYLAAGINETVYFDQVYADNASITNVPD